jgi:phenylacetate-CoA ligase
MLFKRNWDRWDFNAYRAYQGANLNDYLNNQVVKFSPFYSKLHAEGKFQSEKVRSYEDLKYLPFTTKSDMVPTTENPGKPREFILQPNPDTVSSQLTFGRKLDLIKNKLFKGVSFKTQLLEEYLPVFFTATTGRSAGQVSFVYTHYDVLRLKEAGRRLYDVCGAVQGKDTVLNLFPYAPHLAFWAVYNGGEVSHVPTFNSGGGKVLGTSRILNIIRGLKPTIIAGVPGYVYHLLRIASEEKMDMSFVRMIALGAERTTQGHRDKFKYFLETGGAKDVKILSTYGCTEARMAWVECPDGDQMGYHLYPDMGIFEIINPDTLESVKEGEPGEIVFSTLNGRGSVVIRFRTGDYAEDGILYKPCPACGRTVPRLQSNITRLSNQKELNLTKVKGTLVNLNQIDMVIHKFMEIVEWQLEIGKVNNDPFENDSVTLFISLRPNTHEQTLVKNLIHEFTERFEFSPNKIVVESTEILLDRLGMESEVKEKRMVDIRDQIAK